MSKRQTDATARPMAQRARYWFERALPGLKSLSRPIVQERIDQINAALSGKSQ